MASSATTGGNPESLAALKQTFETAVNELGGAEANRAKLPIYPRKRQSVATNSGAEDPNRALKNAADALAALWKTPGAKSHLGRSGRKQ